MTPTPTPTSAAPDPNEQFWIQFGQHLGAIVIEEGAQIGLAFLSGFLSKKLGSPINITTSVP